MPALPVPLTANVIGFFVRNRPAEHLLQAVHHLQVIRIEMANRGFGERLRARADECRWGRGR